MDSLWDDNLLKGSISSEVAKYIILDIKPCIDDITDKVGGWVAPLEDLL